MARSLPLIDSELKTTLQFEIDSDRFVVRRAPQVGTPTFFTHLLPTHTEPNKFLCKPRMNHGWTIILTLTLQKQFEAVPELSARDGNLLTVFVVEDSDVVDCKYLEDQIQQYSDYDDVFRKEFLTTIVLLRSIGYDTPIEGLRPVLERYHCRSLIQAKYARPINEYPRGPYLFQDGVLYQTWKIYNDFNHAFVTAAWPSENVPKYVCSFRENSILLSCSMEEPLHYLQHAIKHLPELVYLCRRGCMTERTQSDRWLEIE